MWLECQSLRRAGYDVTVVCPAGPDSHPHEVIDGVEVHTYRPRPSDGSGLGFVSEYAYSFLATARLVLRARRRGGPIDVLQACNPPDIFWPLARWLRLRDRTRFVFDHHDLCPELYRSRFPSGRRLPLRGLLFLERATFRTADAGHLHERLLRADRTEAWAQARVRRHGGSHRSGPGTAEGRPR